MFGMIISYILLTSQAVKSVDERAIRLRGLKFTFCAFYVTITLRLLSPICIMAIVLNRLHERLNKESAHVDGQIESDLAKKRAQSKLLVKEDSSLILEYNTLRALLEKTLSAPEVDKENARLLVNELLELACLLDENYSQCINDVPTALPQSSLKNHQIKYLAWLDMLANPLLSFSDEQTKLGVPYLVSTRFWTDFLNPIRLSLLRVRRLLRLLIPIINDFERYGSWVIWADNLTGPFFAYLGIFFFIPRLFFNLILLLAHVVEHSWMSSEERALGWDVRLDAQWNRMWPQLVNDIAWAINGVLMCFVCIGTLQPVGIYLALVMQFYDLLTSSIRTYYELSRLNGLEVYYGQIENNPLVEEYAAVLHQRILREKQLLYLNFTNFLVLFVAMLLGLPFVVTASPMLALLGASMAIVMTGITFFGRLHLKQPDSKLDKLLGTTMLSLSTPTTVPEPPISLVNLDNVQDTSRPSLSRNSTATMTEPFEETLSQKHSIAPVDESNESREPTFVDSPVFQIEALDMPLNRRLFLPRSDWSNSSLFSSAARLDGSSKSLCSSRSTSKFHSYSPVSIMHSFSKDDLHVPSSARSSTASFFPNSLSKDDFEVSYANCYCVPSY